MTLDLFDRKFPAVSVEIGWGDLTVRTRKRHYLVAFAVAVHRSHAFVQFGDRCHWLRRWH